MTWMPCWQQSPGVGQEVVVKVILRGGEFKHDIATYYGDGKWAAQFWNESCVVAWNDLPIDSAVT